MAGDKSSSAATAPVHISDITPEDVPACTLVRLLAFRSGGGDIYSMMNPPRLVRKDVSDQERIKPRIARAHKELGEKQTYMRKATLASDGSVVGIALWRRHNGEDAGKSNTATDGRTHDGGSGPPSDDTFDPEVDYEAQALYKSATARTDKLIMGDQIYWHPFRILVHPAHQGRGIGKKLVQDGLQYIESRDPFAPVLLHAERAGINMYTNFGFRMVKEDRVTLPVDGHGNPVPTIYSWPTMVRPPTLRQEDIRLLDVQLDDAEACSIIRLRAFTVGDGDIQNFMSPRRLARAHLNDKDRVGPFIQRITNELTGKNKCYARKAILPDGRIVGLAFWFRMVQSDNKEEKEPEPPADPEWDMDAVRRFIASLEVIEYAHLGKTPYWHLRRIAVEPALQGRGIAGLLLKDGLDYISGLGAAEASLPVTLDAERMAIPLYGKFGFRTVETVNFVEPINSDGEQVETTYTWPIMIRPPVIDAARIKIVPVTEADVPAFTEVMELAMRHGPHGDYVHYCFDNKLGRNYSANKTVEGETISHQSAFSASPDDPESGIITRIAKGPSGQVVGAISWKRMVDKGNGPPQHTRESFGTDADFDAMLKAAELKRHAVREEFGAQTRWHISKLGVLPAYQGCKIARSLVQHGVALIRDDLQESSLPATLFCETFLQNFYERCGFSHVKTITASKNDPQRGVEREYSWLLMARTMDSAPPMSSTA